MFSLLLAVAAGLGALALLVGTILSVRARHRRESVAPPQPLGDARGESVAPVAAGPQEVTGEEVDETGKEVGETPVPLPEDEGATSVGKEAGEGVAGAVTDAEICVGGEPGRSAPDTLPRRVPRPVGRGGRPRTAGGSRFSVDKQPLYCHRSLWRWGKIAHRPRRDGA